MKTPNSSPIFDLDKDDIDEHFKEAVEVVVNYDRASASLIQRRLGIGNARSARIIDQLEAAGVVGPAEGFAPRKVLIKSPQELFGDDWERLPNKLDREVEAWMPEPPKNYKVPRGVKLSKSHDIPWSPQFSDVIQTTDFKDSKVEFPIHLGFDDQGNLKTESLVEINNLIIAGNPLSRKEKLVDTFLLTYLLRYNPSELKIIIIDPTHFLDLYDGITHLLSPVIDDYSKAISALKWSLAELDRRLKHFSEAGVRDFSAYNEKSGDLRIPRILILAFLDSFGVEIEDAFVRLTAQGPRTGIHNVLVVDHTSGASLPATVKSNIPARAVLRLTSAGESRAIDVTGGEKLEPGELLYKPNYGSTVKLKAVYTPEVNVKEVVDAVKQ